MGKEKESEKTKIIIREDIRSAADPEKGKTHAYDAAERDTRVVSPHKWIDDDDEPVIRPVGRNTLSGRETQIYPRMDSSRTRIYQGTEGRETQTYRGPESRETQIYPGSEARDAQTYQSLDRKTRVGRDSNTRIVERQKGDSSGTSGSSERKKSFRETALLTAAKLRTMYADVRNVRVGDSRRFARFLKIVAAFALILLLEIGYFGFARSVDNMPTRIKAAQNELELTQKENEILSKEIEDLGDHDSIEKNRQSWERLRDKVEKASEETSF